MIDVHLPYTVRQRVKGREYWYYRRGGAYVRLRGRPGSAEFLEHYAALQRQHDATGRAAPASYSLHALAAAFLASPEWQALADSSKRAYRRYIDDLVETAGEYDARTMPRAWVRRVWEKHSDKPRTAQYYVQTIQRLMAHAIEIGWRTDNPAAGFFLGKTKQRPKAIGHRPWRDHEIAAFREAWPVGTWERTAFELVLNTGQRGQDVNALTWHQVGKDGWFHWVVQLKTGATPAVPIMPALAEALDAWPRRSVLILANERGQPVGIDRFRHRLGKALKAVAPDLTIHGGRYTAAARLHEAGVDDATIGYLTGHKTLEMVRQYSRKRRDVAAGIVKLSDSVKPGRG